MARKAAESRLQTSPSPSLGPPSTGSGPAGSVLAHPTFRDIPKCLFALRSDQAQREYDEIVRVLYDANRLTIGLHRALCSYAMQFDTITVAAAEGKMIRAPAFVQLDK